MNRSIWVFLITNILTFYVYCDIQLLLQKTNATLYTNNKILINFVLQGATSPYNITYLGIPKTWSTLGNDLVINNFSKTLIQQWTFDINITDSRKRSLFQTVKITINKYQIMIYSMTIAQTIDPFGYKDSINVQNNQNNQYNLTNLISRFPGINKNDNIRFNNTYVASSIITPQIIATSQASWTTQRDGRPISASQIKRNAAVLRQNNADKAIANLLFIIQRLNRSIDKIKNSIINQTRIFKNLKDIAFNCSQQLFNIQNNQAKINNAISDRNIKKKQQNIGIQTNNQILQAFQNNITALMNQKIQIQRNISPEGLALIETEKQISNCEGNIRNLTTSVDNITTKIRSNNLEINLAFNSVDDANLRLTTVNSSLSIVKSKIQDLKQQLKQAEQQQLSLLKDQAMFLSVPLQSQIKIDNLNKRNVQLKNNIKNLTDKINQQRNKCDKSTADIMKIKKRISERQLNYSQILSRIQDFKGKVADTEKQIKGLNANIQSLNLQLGALNKQMDKTNLFEMQQKYVCAVSQQKINRQQTRLDDLNAQINQDSLALAQTTKNLQITRVQKQLAQQAIEQIIQQSGNVTLFSFVPNGGSTILGGQPLGNNPSGNALGMAFRVDTIERGSIKVNNMSQYLSTVYGMNIDPTQILKFIKPAPQTIRPTPVNTLDLSSILYPLDDKSRQQIKVLNTSQVNPTQTLSKCLDTGNIQTSSGILQSASLGSITIRDKFNQKGTLSVSPCTKIASTVPNNFFMPGSKVYFSGKPVFNLLSNTIYDAYTILIVPS